MDPSAGATHAGPVAHGPAAHPGMEGLQIPLAITGAEPLLQHQGGLGRISYDTDDREMSHQQMNGGSRSGGSALLGRKHAPDRRPLRFWQPFNDWWRSELDRVGRRPTSHEIGDWWVIDHCYSRAQFCSRLRALISWPRMLARVSAAAMCN